MTTFRRMLAPLALALGLILSQLGGPLSPPGVALAQEQGQVPGDALGGTSDAEIWREIRRGAQGTVSIPNKQAGVMIQSEGESWRAIRNGPLNLVTKDLLRKLDRMMIGEIDGSAEGPSAGPPSKARLISSTAPVCMSLTETSPPDVNATSRPSAMTCRTCLKLSMLASGSAPTITMSASLPGSIVPRRSPSFRICAPTRVAAARRYSSSHSRCPRARVSSPS